MDSSDDGSVCFGDIITVPYSTPEELFTAIFGFEDIGVPTSDIRVCLDENNNPLIELDFYESKEYDFEYCYGLQMYNKITSFLERTERILSSTHYLLKGHEITDEEACSIMNGEMINAGTNTPIQADDDEIDDDPDDGEQTEEFSLQDYLKFNEDAQDVLLNISNQIIELTDENTFNYLFQTIQTESIYIMNDLYK